MLPIEEKESYRRLQAFEQTLALAPPGVEVITVCDREADIYEMWVSGISHGECASYTTSERLIEFLSRYGGVIN